jgi:hypothetical protein
MRVHVNTAGVTMKERTGHTFRRAPTRPASSATVICAVPSTVARIVATGLPMRALTSAIAVLRTPLMPFTIGVRASMVQFAGWMNSTLGSHQREYIDRE